MCCSGECATRAVKGASFMNVAGMDVAGHYQNTPIWFRNLVSFFTLCLVYVLASKLGDLFVIPPGFVSVTWPAAGVGLGFVYVLGNKAAICVFLARFIMVVAVYKTPDFSDILVTTSLATGAALHAIVGTYLIRRFTSAELYMGSLRDILIFLLIGGPITCAMTATISGLAFANFASLSSGDFVDFIKIWWVGDIFGVIVFAPLTVVILSHIRCRNKLAKSTFFTIIVPLLVSISVFIFVFDSSKKQWLKHTFDEYSSEVHTIVDQFTEMLAVDITAVNATGSFVEASENVTASEFKIFTKPLFDTPWGLYGLSWLPKIDHQNREKFVANIRGQGFSTFEIRSRDKFGKLTISADRQVYFPLAFTEPYEQNQLAHGFDVYGVDGISGALRRDTLDEARDKRIARATSRFSIVQKQDEYGFIIYFPVFKKFLGQKERVHIGYINGIFVFPTLVQSLVEASSSIESDFFLTEISAGAEPLVLFDSRTSDNKDGAAESYVLDRIVHTEQEFEVAGKRWKVTFIKNGPLLTGDYIKSLWGLAGGGAVFITLFLVVLMMIASQNNFVQNLVEQRTRDLKHANEELEEFAYRTSHDLRSPIVSSVTLLSLADESINNGDTEAARSSISHAKKSLSKLEILISDILTLTRIGSANESDVYLTISEVIDDAISKLDHANGFEKLSIERDIRIEEGIMTKPSRLKLILENLISNAAKYHDPEEVKPMLKISCYQLAEELHLEFSDNGLGIREEYRHQVFDMFKRFHPRVAEGTGLGLYLMKRSAHMLGGEISYHPLEKGSLFRLIIPIK